MAYDLQNKLVIAVASSALFDLTESDQVFRTQGDEKYRQYQRRHQKDILRPGLAFDFVKRVLSLNDEAAREPIVEVILLSRNDPDTGLRVMHSIKEMGLNITRSMFLAGSSPYPYIPAFNVCLFLSANEQDIRDAIAQGYPAGQVVGASPLSAPGDSELRIAFDFDGVIADDAAEAVFANSGNDIEAFASSEANQADSPHAPGPLKPLLARLAAVQQWERDHAEKHEGYTPKIRIAIITARGAPAHERVVTSLRSWGLRVDETFFLGGISKVKVLEVYRPHIFFDDQLGHLEPAQDVVAGVHIPFGVRNR